MFSYVPAGVPRTNTLIILLVLLIVSGSVGLYIGYICMLASVPYKKSGGNDPVSNSLTAQDKDKDGQGSVYVE